MLRRILILIPVVLIGFVAGANIVGYAFWPDDSREFSYAPCRRDFAPSADVEMTLAQKLGWMGLSLTVPSAIGPYQLVAAYPEEMSLLYRSKSKGRLLFQISSVPQQQRLAVVARFPESLILYSRFAPNMMARAMCMDNKFRWSVNPVYAITQPALVGLRGMALKAQSGVRPIWTAVQMEGEQLRTWSVFAEPERPNRLYSISVSESGSSAQLRVVFNPVIGGADELTATLVGLLRFEPGPKKTPDNICRDFAELSGECQAALVARLLNEKGALDHAGRLLGVYRASADVTGAQALLDYYRAGRFLNRDIREFYQRIQKEFALTDASDVR
jgi:hypothetical protein